MSGKTVKEVSSMDENNTTNPNEKNESKPAVTQATATDQPTQAKPKQTKKDDKPSFSDTIADYKAEFRKIIWPKRDELAKKTVTVIFTSLLVGAIIFCMDTIYTAGYGLILNLLG